MAQKSKPLDRPRQSRSKAAPKAEKTGAVARHEDLQAAGEIQIGKYLNLKGTAKISPAGVICVGIAGVAVLASAAVLVHVARRRY